LLWNDGGPGSVRRTRLPLATECHYSPQAIWLMANRVLSTEPGHPTGARLSYLVRYQQAINATSIFNLVSLAGPDAGRDFHWNDGWPGFVRRTRLPLATECHYSPHQ